MKIYLDIVFIINLAFDFLLLLSVSIILKRNVKLRKIFLGSLVGAISIFTLFLKINSLELFLIKVLISILMVLVTFNFKNLKYTLKNLGFLYMASIILGGFLYFLNVEFSYKQVGLVFYFKGLSINFVFLIITSPIILYIYIRQIKELKNNYSHYYKVDLYYQGKIYKLNAYLDTGNKLIDNITKKPVVIINKKIKVNKYWYVPYKTISGEGLIKCFKADKLVIDSSLEVKDFVVGISKIEMEGIDCILGEKVMEC